MSSPFGVASRRTELAVRPGVGALLLVGAGLVVVAIAASLVPALRIGRLDPAGMLRHE